MIRQCGDHSRNGWTPAEWTRAFKANPFEGDGFDGSSVDLAVLLFVHNPDDGADDNDEDEDEDDEDEEEDDDEELFGNCALFRLA